MVTLLIVLVIFFSWMLIARPDFKSTFIQPPPAAHQPRIAEPRHDESTSTSLSLFVVRD